MNLRKLLQRYIGTVGLLLAAIGAAMLALSTTATRLGAVANLLSNLGSTFVGTGLLTLIYRLYVADVLETRELDSSGLSAFRMRRADLFATVNLSEMMKHSGSLKVMGITVASILEEFGSTGVARLAASGCEFTFLLMDPNSPLVRARETSENRPQHYLSDRVEASIATARLIRLQLTPTNRSRISIKIYDYDYSASLVLGDDKVLFQPYLEREDANNSAVYVYDNNPGGMYERLRRHFQAVESRSVEITVPTLVITYGHTCAGKTAISRKIARHFDLSLIATYEVRQHLFPELTDPAAYKLSSAQYRNTAEEVYRGVRQELDSRLIKSPRGVVVDASFPFKRWRTAVYEIARRAGARLVIVHCECSDEEVVRRRLAERAANPSLLPTERARDFDVYTSSIRDVEMLDPTEWAPYEIDVHVIKHDSSGQQLDILEELPDPLRLEFQQSVALPERSSLLSF